MSDQYLEQFEVILDGVDDLRSHVLLHDKENLPLRAKLRDMVHRLERLRARPQVSVANHQRLQTLFSSLLDAEHGALLKTLADSDNPDSERLEEYVASQHQLISQSSQLLPTITEHLDQISKLFDLAEIEVSEDVSQRCRRLIKAVKLHLIDDKQLHQELQGLVDAMRNSMQGLTALLLEVGDDAPEIREAQALLDAELPDDPKAAQQMLQQARESLVKAGSKLQDAAENVRETMQENLSHMKKLSDDLDKAESMARCDVLTGLANRRKLNEFLATDFQGIVCFLLLDIDHFKNVNDTYGHDAGDEVLSTLASVLLSCVRESDLVARMGGEEFAVVLPSVGGQQAFKMAEELRKAVELHGFETSVGKIPVTISIGIAVRRLDEPEDAWIKRADQALYQAKGSGRNCSKSAVS
ncbi:MAG: diguanylate cyclase [Mariprofundaceae bacterium]